jgi:RNA polymerase sigma-70 factor (ECF subfamily)
MVQTLDQSTLQRDDELWSRFVEGNDRAAFETLVDAYRDNVFDLALRLLRNRALAEEVAQEVFLTMYTKRQARKPGVPLCAWLLKITRNVSIDCSRSNNQRKAREDRYAMSGTQSVEAKTVDVDSAELRASLDRLPEDFQVPVALHFLHGLSQPEIAQTLDLPLGTVGSRIARGIEKLRAELGVKAAGASMALGSVALLENALRTLPLAKAPSTVGVVSGSIGSIGSGAAKAGAKKLLVGKAVATSTLSAKAIGAVVVLTLAAGSAAVAISHNRTTPQAAAPAPIAAPKDDAKPAPSTGSKVGIVSQIKVVSDKVPDISSMEAWKKSYIKDGMTDEEKAMQVWRTVATFQHQDSGVMEYLQNENTLQDALKCFNVYGHSFCGMAAAHSMELARYIGLEARGYTINCHVVPEIKWDGAWHLLDSSLIVYFPKADKKIASVDEIVAAVKDWYAKNPDYWDDKAKDGIEEKLRKLHGENGWTGWKKGPELLNNCPTYSPNGWVPAATHGWYSTMLEYDGKPGTPFLYEMGFSQGYQVNIQLRKGEKLTRNWSNKGLCMESTPGCLKLTVADGNLAYSARMFGDIANGRIGNGTVEYNAPLQSEEFRDSALTYENLDDAAHVKDAARDGVLVIRMPSSYVYLTGQLNFKSAIGDGGEIQVLLSDNNGLDWKDVLKVNATGTQTADLKPFSYRRYDYRLKFVMKGKGTGLDSLSITHDIQHSQRPLPALGQGENKIAFSSGNEGTITIEGSHNKEAVGKQLLVSDFHPVANNVTIMPEIRVTAPKGDLTFPVETPGDMTRIRFGLSGRVHDKNDLWNLQVSFDDGKTFKTIDTLKGPARFASKWVTASDIPAGTHKALVRYAGENAAAAMIFDFRIDADYKQPAGGFVPVKVTYTWDENGKEKQDVHIAKSAEDAYTINCETKPTMKSIALELAE